MINSGKHRRIFLIASLIVFLVPTASTAAPRVSAAYLYNLSDFSGTIPYNLVNLAADPKANEVYVTDSRENDVAIFDEHGMEIYRFGQDAPIGNLSGVAVDKEGDILVLYSTIGGRRQILLCNFRGEVISNVELKDLPAEFAGFSPGRMIYRDEKLYLADPGGMQIVVADIQGNFQRGYDVGSLLGLDRAKRADTGLDGFGLDRDGNILLTSALLFSAYRLSPSGVITGFGERGSAPGKFGIVGDIVSDERGNIFVADRLRSVVLIFNHDLKFLNEFGYRGFSAENLIGPASLAVDGAGRIYVSQLRNRGVSVFKITVD